MNYAKQTISILRLPFSLFSSFNIPSLCLKFPLFYFALHFFSTFSYPLAPLFLFLFLFLFLALFLFLFLSFSLSFSLSLPLSPSIHMILENTRSLFLFSCLSSLSFSFLISSLFFSFLISLFLSSLILSLSLSFSIISSPLSSPISHRIYSLSLSRFISPIFSPLFHHLHPPFIPLIPLVRPLLGKIHKEHSPGDFIWNNSQRSEDNLLNGRLSYFIHLHWFHFFFNLFIHRSIYLSSYRYLLSVTWSYIHSFIHSFIHLLIYIFKSSFYFLLSLHDYYPESRLFSDLLIHIRTLYFPSLPCSLFSDSNSNGKWRPGAEKSKKNIFSEIQEKLWLNECP